MALDTDLKNKIELSEHVLHTLPIIFLKDVNGKYKNANLNQAKIFGLKDPSEISGKTIFQLVKDQELAKQIDDSDKQVIKSGISLTVEEEIETPSGPRRYLSQKHPSFDAKGKVNGIIGFAVDITDYSKPVQADKDKDEMLKIARQVAHDIRSPLMSLLIITQACKEIPEPERIALREVATSIEDIANNLINKYMKNEDPTEEFLPILLSTTLLQILSEKKYQYKNSQVIFNHKFSPKSNFIFINAERVSFKRMISNIIDDAIESSDEPITHINIMLDIESKNAKITIENNSRGTSKIITNNITNPGKNSDTGIGLSQIKEALELNKGKLNVNSLLGQGTEVYLTFPIVSSPGWFVNEITLNYDDILVILDDDFSTHDAWNRKLKPILKNSPEIQVKYFHEGQAAINFINNLSSQDKDRTVLFTDYELLNQGLTGVDVITKGDIQRATLVTSHSNMEIFDEAIKVGAKVLPKQLVSEISIIVDNSAKAEGSSSDNRPIDFVVVDDNKRLGKIFKLWANQKISMDFYYDPVEFLNNINKYPVTTKIYLDYDFKLANITGLTLAEKLHNLGFTNLYLLTGRDFNKSQIPGYLELIHKHKIQNIKALFTGK